MHGYAWCVCFSIILLVAGTVAISLWFSFTDAKPKENKLFYTQQANGIMGLAPVLPAAWAPMEAGVESANRYMRDIWQKYGKHKMIQAKQIADPIRAYCVKSMSEDRSLSEAAQPPEILSDLFRNLSVIWHGYYHKSMMCRQPSSERHCLSLLHLLFFFDVFLVA